jgi:hypothetical protein
MAARASMQNLVDYTRTLINAPPTAQVSDDRIQEVLDYNRTWFEWILLDNDVDYNHYYMRAYGHEIRVTGSRQIRQVNVPDFSGYTKCGFIETDFQLRNGRGKTNTLHTATTYTFQDGTFVFSTAPNVDLYFFGKGYNVYQAAIQLIEEDPDIPMQGFRSHRSLQRTYVFDTEGRIKRLKAQAFGLNRRKPRLHRA